MNEQWKYTNNDNFTLFNMSVISVKIGWLQGSVTHNENYPADVPLFKLLEFRWSKIVLDSKYIIVILR